MTLGDAMVRLVLTFYGTFAVVFLGGMALGALLAWGLLRARGDGDECAAVADDAWLERVLDEPVFREFKPGVAKVGDL